MRTIYLAGSTGSIGRQAVDVISAEPERWRVLAISSGGSRIAELAEQARVLRPEIVAVADPSLVPVISPLLPAGTEVLAGEDELADPAAQADVTLNAVVGFAGLKVTLSSLRAGRRLALANKESLVAGAPVVQAARATAGAELLPVDSEHCAIHQCLRSGEMGEVEKLILTASGGPFRGRSAEELGSVSLEEALSHPTWRMGPKITVDSSTLMNKGLEVIEAHELFGVPYDRIDVVVHPQSVVHSMVSFADGSTVAQLSMPDMRLPIGYAIGWPKRMAHPYGATIDWTQLSRLEFEPPDFRSFPCLSLAYEAGRAGGTAPAWINAANEVAVAAFLEGRLAWQAIAEVVERTLSSHCPFTPTSLGEVLEADREARSVAQEAVEVRSAS